MGQSKGRHLDMLGQAKKILQNELRSLVKAALVLLTKSVIWSILLSKIYQFSKEAIGSKYL